MKKLPVFALLFFVYASLFADYGNPLPIDRFPHGYSTYLYLRYGADKAVEESLEEDSTLAIWSGHLHGSSNYKALKCEGDGKYYICPLKFALDNKDKKETEISAEMAKEILEILTKESLPAIGVYDLGFISMSLLTNDTPAGEFYLKMDGKVISTYTQHPAEGGMPYLLWKLASKDVPESKDIEAIKNFYKNDPRNMPAKEENEKAARIKFLRKRLNELDYMPPSIMASTDVFKDKSVLAVFSGKGMVHSTDKILQFKDGKYYFSATYDALYSEEKKLTEISEETAKELLQIFKKEISFSHWEGFLTDFEDGYWQDIYLRNGEKIERGGAQNSDKNSMPHILYKMMAKDAPGAVDFQTVGNFYKSDTRTPKIDDEKSRAAGKKETGELWNEFQKLRNEKRNSLEK